MLVLASIVYFFNLLCALVPCQGTWKQTESFISSEFRSRHDNSVINSHPIVGTELGQVQGYSMGTVSGRRVYAFEGIPFAEPPVGHLRFRPPKPRHPWAGVLKAMRVRPNCLQMNPLTLLRVVGSEDCLYLNVYTPKIPENHCSNNTTNPAKLPVIVFIHGGSFYFGGAGEYGPAYLLTKDVLLVTIAYRQGVLGFLSTGDAASPGNYGLKDQSLALKWVHGNIQNFGGDPNKITLFGQSAGGVSVHFHMMSPRSQPYFRNAYTLSGSGFLFWSYHTPEEAYKMTKKLASVFKCPTWSTWALMKCLRGQQPEKLDFIPVPLVLFRPVIEPPETPDGFLTHTPAEAYARGLVAKKPWVISALPDEGQLAVYLLKIRLRLRYTKDNIFQEMPVLMEYRDAKNRDQITTDILNYYLGTADPKKLPDTFLTEIATDRYFYNGLQRAVQAHSAIAPVFPLLFNFTGRFNSGGHLFGAAESDWRLAHNEDLYYYLNASIYADGYSLREREYTMTQYLATYLSNFATHDDPGANRALDTNPIEWEPVKDGRLFRWYETGTKFRMVPNTRYHQLQFWEALGIPREESLTASFSRLKSR